MSCDAIVIGGGPAGAATAILLAQAGWWVVVVEKRRFPRRKVCGEFLSASNTALLDRLGISEAYRASAGLQVRRIAVFAGDASIAAEAPRGSSGSAGWGRALGRETFDALLLERAAAVGAEVLQPWKVVSVGPSRDGFICRIAAAEGDGERRIEAPVVVAAHGSWEKGGLPTQASRAHGPADLLAFKAHFRDAGLATDLMPLIAFPGGYGGLVNSDSGRLSMSLCIRRDTLARCRERNPASPAGDAVLAHIRTSVSGVRDALCDAQLDGPWLAAGPIAPGMRPPLQDGVFLVGNAAGEAHPIIAEGIGMALHSAALLADRFIAAGSSARAAASRQTIGAAYQRDWRATFATRLKAAQIFAAIAMRPKAAAAAAPLLAQFPGLMTWGAELSGKIAPFHARERIGEAAGG
jgi:flavin-dependent dehydrogenase